MQISPTHAGLGFLFLFALLAGSTGTAAENLLRNPGFEDALAPVWEKRTPEDASRSIRCTGDTKRSGQSSVVLTNIESAYTRLRQGHDRSIVIAPGNLIELSAWLKSDLSDEAAVTVQIYCMSEDDKILAQPMSRPVRGSCDWTVLRVRAVVPEATAYVMAYLQVREGVGPAVFDDVELVVRRPPRSVPPLPRIGLLTDLPEDSPCVRSLKILFGDGLVPVATANAQRQLADCVGALVLFEHEAVPGPVLDAVEQYVRAGGRVFADIRNFAQWRGIDSKSVRVAADSGQSVGQQMAAGLRVVVPSQVTAGFATGQIIPRAAYPSGELVVLPKEQSKAELEVLAVAPDGSPGLVRMPMGDGFVVAADVLSLREPAYRHIDGYYKYTLITNTLTNAVRFGEYYSKKLSYSEFVDRMKELATQHSAIRIEDEGPASDDYRIFSLNLGRPGAPLYLLYAAAHGSEWEPGYGLMTFAKRIAEGRLEDVIDLDKVAIKIVPYVNPWGYDNRRRHNAQGVDLNRQGDHRWQEFQGRDSNEDGTWSPGDYDWKGTSPFCEPESRTYKAILERSRNLYCVLDFHGNSSAKSNKVAILPATGHPDNELHAWDLQETANRRLRGRHLLRQNDEEGFSQYLLDRVVMGAGYPYLMNTSARDRYGVLIELTAGYASTYGTVLQTDVTCELCRALFVAYRPPE